MDFLFSVLEFIVELVLLVLVAAVFIVLFWFLIAIGGSPATPVTPTAGAPRSKPPQRLLRNPRDFELAAADWLQYWGFEDAQATPVGADGGIDVEGKRIAAQVKSVTAPPISRPLVQQISGAARNKDVAFFSLCEYTRQAVAWANQADVALFRFAGYDGAVEPANEVAVRLISRAQQTRVGRVAANTGRKPSSMERRAAAIVLDVLDEAEGYHLSTPIGTFLTRLPGIGPRTCDRLLRRLKLKQVVLLQDLTDEQRRALMEVAAHWYDPPDDDLPTNH